MNKLAKRLKEAVVKNLMNVKEDRLNEHYLTCSSGTYSRKELAGEIENETEVGLRQLESIILLAQHFFDKENKQQTKQHKSE